VTCQIESIFIGSHLQHLQAAHSRLVGGGLQVSTILIHIRGLVLQGYKGAQGVSNPDIYKRFSVAGVEGGSRCQQS
jgi:hypothetical protein